MQVIVLATITLGVASLCTIAVPKLAGDLIDICIHYGQGSFDADAAKHQLNGDATTNAFWHVSPVLQSSVHPSHELCVKCRHALQNPDCTGSWRNGKWLSLMVGWVLLSQLLFFVNRTHVASTLLQC